MLLSGWLDNANALARELGLDHGAAPETIYGAAVERWGVQADARIIGTYAALIVQADGTIRLSRSPWSSFPLFYHVSANAILAASVPRPLFAAGLAKQFDESELEALVRLELPNDEQSLFKALAVVPQGSVVVLGNGPACIERWYDPLSLPDVRFKDDSGYEDAARALLEQAVAAALSGAERPGIALSGGLDSALAASEVLRQLPASQHLPSFTFVPLAQFDGITAPHKFGDDRPWVEAFAARHPRLAPHFVDNAGIGFDDRAEAMFLACGAGYPARVSGSVYHGVYAAAQAAGCDRLLLADAGNMTLSSAAPWAAREFGRSGQWRALWRLLRSDPVDQRPTWRRFAQNMLMMNLPSVFGDRLRQLFARPTRRQRFANPFLYRDRRDSRSTARVGIVDIAGDRSREDFVIGQYRGCGAGNEIAHSFEQVFGIRARDVFAYRPLIEFCMGLPTDQFVRDGEARFLARRLARGRLPEAQRVNRLYGGHNVDWHARLTPRLAELRAAAGQIADLPELAGLIDASALQAAFDRWPERTPTDQREADHYQFMIPAQLYMARYVAFETGRNLPGALP